MPDVPQKPKDLLLAQAALPKVIEASLPTGAPAISEVLVSLAQNVPDIALPALPASIPGLPKPLMAPAGMPGAEILKSLEMQLPSGTPRLVGNMTGQTTKVGITESSKPAARAFKIGV